MLLLLYHDWNNSECKDSPLQALAIVNTVLIMAYVKPYIVDSLVSNNGNEIKFTQKRKS